VFPFLNIENHFKKKHFLKRKHLSHSTLLTSPLLVTLTITFASLCKARAAAEEAEAADAARVAREINEERAERLRQIELTRAKLAEARKRLAVEAFATVRAAKARQQKRAEIAAITLRLREADRNAKSLLSPHFRSVFSIFIFVIFVFLN